MDRILVEKLSEFENKIKNMPEIKGAFYTGSIARGEADKYSDIDMNIIIKKKDNKKTLKKLKELVSIFGKIKIYNMYSYSEGGLSITSFIGESFLKVDITLHQLESVKPSSEFKYMLIIKDNNRFIENLKKKSKKVNVRIPSVKEFKQFLFELIDSQIYAARHTARGWELSAIGEAEYEGRRLFDILAKLRGREQYGFREVEKWMSREELSMLEATRCNSTKTEDIKRTMRAVWKFAEYVKKEYEKVMKVKVKLSYDYKEILKIANKIYDSNK